jgi:hypothetical protein
MCISVFAYSDCKLQVSDLKLLRSKPSERGACRLAQEMLENTREAASGRTSRLAHQ